MVKRSRTIRAKKRPTARAGGMLQPKRSGGFVVVAGCALFAAISSMLFVNLKWPSTTIGLELALGIAAITGALVGGLVGMAVVFETNPCAWNRFKYTKWKPLKRNARASVKPFLLTTGMLILITLSIILHGGLSSL